MPATAASTCAASTTLHLLHKLVVCSRRVATRLAHSPPCSRALRVFLACTAHERTALALAAACTERLCRRQLQRGPPGHAGGRQEPELDGVAPTVHRVATAMGRRHNLRLVVERGHEAAAGRCPGSEHAAVAAVVAGGLGEAAVGLRAVAARGALCVVRARESRARTLRTRRRQVCCLRHNQRRRRSRVLAIAPATVRVAVVGAWPGWRGGRVDRPSVQGRSCLGRGGGREYRGFEPVHSPHRLGGCSHDGGQRWTRWCAVVGVVTNGTATARCACVLHAVPWWQWRWRRRRRRGSRRLWWRRRRQ